MLIKKAGLFDRVKEQLVDNPRQQTNNRKLLRPHPLYPTTKEFWELRFGDIHVFYFTSEQPKKMVTVISIGEKEGNVVRIEGKLMSGSELIAWLVSVEDE